MSELKNFFSAATEIVDKTLDEILPSAEIAPKRLHEAVRWSIFAGGKRFRPALVLIVGKMFDVASEKLLRCAAAVEMIHTYSLIHDDLPAMDDDDLRRGRASCHKKFDEATAILAGDFLQSAAFGAISTDENLSVETRLQLISELSEAASKMVFGQQFDLEAEGRKISVDELKNIHKNKTGAMIRVAARFGAIVGKASEKDLKAVTSYASSLGLLFQVTDDLLDITQTTEILGKTAGKDLTAEKSTYPSFYGIEETRKLAEKIHAEAVRELKKIKKDTTLAENLADFILLREK